MASLQTTSISGNLIVENKTNDIAVKIITNDEKVIALKIGTVELSQKDIYNMTHGIYFNGKWCSFSISDGILNIIPIS